MATIDEDFFEPDSEFAFAFAQSHYRFQKDSAAKTLILPRKWDSKTSAKVENMSGRIPAFAWFD
jgi:hypothetical protein